MKIATSNLHLGLLDNSRQKLLQKLIPLSKGFILGGGTALALQMNHRQSFDFDFFSPTEIPKGLLKKVSDTIAIAVVSIDNESELTFLNEQNIKTTFLYYPFTNQFDILQTEQSLQLYSIQDLAIHKAYTIGRHGEYRDYFDLFTILKLGKMTLDQIITGAASVYGNLFNPKIFLEQLIYFDDLRNLEIIPVSDVVAASSHEVQQFLETAVHNYLYNMRYHLDQK